jgi:hypothetical protein
MKNLTFEQLLVLLLFILLPLLNWLLVQLLAKRRTARQAAEPFNRKTKTPDRGYFFRSRTSTSAVLTR